MKGYSFDEKKHIHTLDGKNLFGVTSVLRSWGDKNNLIGWAANMAVVYIEKELLYIKNSGFSLDEIVQEKWDEILGQARSAHTKKRDKAGDKGKEVHKLVEEYVRLCIDENKGAALNVDPEYKGKKIMPFIDWSTQNKVKFLSSEENLYSRDLWCGGIVDFTCEIDGKTFLGDLKTGNTIQTTAFYQCAAYVLMAEEQGRKFDGTIVIHLPSKGELKEYKRFDLETDKQAFLGILTAYKADKTYKL